MPAAAQEEMFSPPMVRRGEEIFFLAAAVAAEVETPIVASKANNEKPHQGVARQNRAPHLGQAVCNCTIALGVSWCWWSETALGAGDSYDYDAFGNLTNSTGSTPNVYLFAGEQFDPALSLYYNRARYLNTATGRFWSMDTYEGDDEVPLSLHKYSYTQVDPVDGLDPSGFSLADLIRGQEVHQKIGAIFRLWAYDPILGPGLSDPTIKQVLGRSVPGFSRFRPDLVDRRTGEVYEIKPIGSESLGYSQLGGYLIILNLSDPLHRAWIPGESFQPPDLPSFLELDPNTVAIIDPPLEGLITYEVLDSRELVADGLLSLAGAVRLASAASSAETAEIGLDVGVAGLNAQAGLP